MILALHVAGKAEPEPGFPGLEGDISHSYEVPYSNGLVCEVS